MDKQDFVGAWALQSWSGTQSDGQVIQPYGDAPRGYIIYSSSGHMSAQIQGNGGEGVTGEGLFLAYGGPFSVTGRTVTHHVELANWTPMIGTDQAREAAFSGDELTLSATANGVTHTISWRRA